MPSLNKAFREVIGMFHILIEIKRKKRVLHDASINTLSQYLTFNFQQFLAFSVHRWRWGI